MGCHFLLQGIFCTQGWNPRLLHLLPWQAGCFTTSATWEALQSAPTQTHTQKQCWLIDAASGPVLLIQAEATQSRSGWTPAQRRLCWPWGRRGASGQRGGDQGLAGERGTSCWVLGFGQTNLTEQGKVLGLAFEVFSLKNKVCFMKFPLLKSQLDRHGAPGLLAGGVGREAAQPGPHTITPTGPTISHKQLCGEAEPDDTPSLHLGSLTRTLGELLGELLALPALHL